MDLGTMIITVVFVLICAIPFIAMYRKSNNKEKQIFNALKQEALSNHHSISTHDIWNHRAIGFDETSQTIYFTNTSELLKDSFHINLADIKVCIKKITSRQNSNGQADVGDTEKLELNFSNKSKEMPDVNIEFYNSNQDGLTLSREYLLLEKWYSFINQKISSINP